MAMTDTPTPSSRPSVRAPLPKRSIARQPMPSAEMVMRMTWMSAASASALP